MLTPLKERFVDEYLVDLNCTQAALRAGCSPRSAHTSGWRMLQDAEVADAITARRVDLVERTHVTQERIILELARVAFTNIDEVFPWTERGPNLIDSALLDDRVKAAIAKVKVKRRREVVGRGDDAESWEVEEQEVQMHDKLSALDKLAKHLGMYPKEPPIIEVNDNRQLNIAALSVDELRALLAMGRGTSA